jgi:hypothetical protein
MQDSYTIVYIRRSAATKNSTQRQTQITESTQTNQCLSPFRWHTSIVPLLFCGRIGAGASPFDSFLLGSSRRSTEWTEESRSHLRKNSTWLCGERHCWTVSLFVRLCTSVRLQVYILDYLTKKKMTGAALAFSQAIGPVPPAIDTSSSFLYEWWVVFWDVFTSQNSHLVSQVQFLCCWGFSNLVTHPSVRLDE